MESKIKKVFFILLFLFVIFLVFNLNISLAADTGKDAIDIFNNAAETVDTSAGTAFNATTKFIRNLIFLVQVICNGIATIMLIVLGIKYISSSPEEKAEIKKHLVMYVVGAMILYAGSAVLNVLKKFVLGNFK